MERRISQENWTTEDARMTNDWMYERFGVDERPTKPKFITPKSSETVLFDESAMCKEGGLEIDLA